MKNIKEKMNNKGFTLMELIIVVAILAILIALIAPNLVGFLDSATKTSRDANAKTAYTVASAWATQMRVESKKVADETISVSYTGVSAKDDCFATVINGETLGSMLNSGALSEGIKIDIQFKDKKCVKAVVYEDSVLVAEYPKANKE